MNRTIAGAVIILILIVAGAVSAKFLLPILEKSRQKATTDAVRTKGKIHIALDNWIGYFVLTSPEMKSTMRRAGYILVCEDDHADYGQRMQRLKEGQIDFAVATVDSFILNGAGYNFPGAIVMVIDESKGGDAIVARKERVAGLDALKGRDDVRVAFTPASPSHHLAKAAADHFNVPELLPSGQLRIETDGSEKAMEKLLSDQTDVAICWEPDVSRALANANVVKLLGTEDTERLIVDILIASRKTLQKNPHLIQLLLNTYFRVLKKYRSQPDLLIDHVKAHTGLDQKSVAAILKGVHWVNFNENCERWYGIAAPGQYAAEGLIDTISATVRILINAGDFSISPVPDNDPYRLTNSTFLETIFTRGVTGFTNSKGGNGSKAVSSLEARFNALSDNQWQELKAVGTLKVDPIVFQQGTANLDLRANQVIDQAVDRLKHYPHFRVKISGHTDVRGDAQQNTLLSKQRAAAVATYLKKNYHIDPNRLQVLGFGGSKPLPRKSGESRRTWMYRLSRVELILVREDF